MQFYSVSHNSFVNEGFPWINRVTSGLFNEAQCPICGRRPRVPSGGDIEATLEPRLGSGWPDVLGCGAYPFFIVSPRVIDAWREERIGEFPHHKVTIVGPLPKRLVYKNQPDYCWLDGAKMQGALFDYNMSGFVGLYFCKGCGAAEFDVSATYDRQHSRKYPYAFTTGSWHAANVFTTDLSPTLFFCTEALLQCARQHRLTNFRFLDVEDGGAPGNTGIEYLEH
ncbi:MAG TPA: hypothetical protein VKN18_17545 [Blastocatellia bacterium]|nr:hypothetical protein [Blastocatellia bacterium]